MAKETVKSAIREMVELLEGTKGVSGIVATRPPGVLKAMKEAKAALARLYAETQAVDSPSMNKVVGPHVKEVISALDELAASWALN